LAGNEYQTEPFTGRYDASYGCLFRLPTLTNVPFMQSGFFVKGDVKDLKYIKGNNTAYVIAAINNEPLQIFKQNFYSQQSTK
jgi:enediyne biosynthesis protein E4